MPDQEKTEGIIKERKKKGLAVVISAPSGAGKTSILFMYMRRHTEAVFSVSVTTRPPRAGEKDGRNYHFVSPAEFESLKNSGELLEWNQVFGHHYGTPKKSFFNAIEQGQTIILDTDIIGALNIKKLYHDAVLVFIIPSSPEILRERLSRRNTETRDRLEQRFSAFPQEIASMEEYDYIIINDELEVAVSQFSAIIEAEHHRSSRVIDTLDQWRNYQHGRIQNP